MTAPTIETPTRCPDPFEHERWYLNSEDTWRKTPEQRAADRTPGRCVHCGGLISVRGAA